MVDIHSRTGQRVAEEHQEKLVSGELLPLYTDYYQYFGWELESQHRPIMGINRHALRFKRDRKILNRVELTRLQRQFDSYTREIESMERSKTITASIVAYTVGIVGTALMAASVFSYLAGLIPLSIVFAIPGFIGWGVSFFCYKAAGKRKAAEVQPFIDQKYEDLYAVCERAHSLSNL